MVVCGRPELPCDVCLSAFRARKGGFPCCHILNGWNCTDDFGLKSRRMEMNLQETWKVKIFPNTSFGNFHALMDSNLLTIWKLTMLVHIHLKPDIYPKASFWYFLLFQMWSIHLQSEFARSFEESYQLHSSIKILNITKGKFWHFKLFWLWIMHRDIRIWWKDEEPYILTTCLWNLNNSRRQYVQFFRSLKKHLQFSIWCEDEEPFVLPICIWTIVSNVMYALTSPIL
jgi:hypothetical protein